MIKINVKPMTVNQAWQGRRVKTAQYRKYERDLLLILPPFTVPEGDLGIELVFGVSYSGSDWDNPIKPFQDVLQKKYGFNDSRIIEATVKKIKTKKGSEFIEWRIYAT